MQEDSSFQVEINAETKVFAIIGKPVKHSLSPALHTSMFRRHNINAVYVAFEPEDAQEALRAVKALKINGLNVTVPFKEAACESADELSNEAKIIGAVNTIVNRKGKLHGYNTDYLGFIEMYNAIVSTRKPTQPLVVGAGGAARAILYALYKLGYEVVYIKNRTQSRIMELQKRFKNLIEIRSVKDVKSTGADLIINCTSVGLDGKSLPIEPDDLVDNVAVMDIIYTDTPLIKKAREKKLTAINGMRMFVYQAYYAFELFTGVRFDIDFAFDLLKRVKQ